MKRIALALSIFALFGVALATGEDAKAVKKAIEANYAGISKAFVDQDFKAFGAYMTEDFKATVVNNDKTMDRDKSISDFTQMRATLSDVKWIKKIKKVELDGTTAHITAEGKITAKLNMHDGKDHPFNFNATSIDDWVKVGNNWLLKASKTLNFEAKLDGKPLNHG